MKTIFIRLDNYLYKCSDLITWIAYLTITIVVLLTVSDIILRYVFNHPLSYAVEIVELGLCLTVFISIAACTAHKSHVNIDILLTRLSQRRQAITNSGIYFFTTIMLGILCWRLISYALLSKEIGQVSTMLKLPIYVFILIAAICILLTTLLFLSQCIHFVIKSGER